MYRITGTHGRPSWHPAWSARVRTAVVTAACLIGEAIVAKNVMDVSINIVAFLAPLWVLIVSFAWPTIDRRREIAIMLLTVAATTGVLVYYGL